MWHPGASNLVLVHLLCYNNYNTHLMKGSLMFNRYAMVAIVPMVMFVGCGEVQSEDTADPALSRYTVEVRGMS